MYDLHVLQLRIVTAHPSHHWCPIREEVIGFYLGRGYADKVPHVQMAEGAAGLRRIFGIPAALPQNRLGISAVVMFVMTAATPLVAAGALVSEGWAVTGVTGMPLAFIVIGLLLAVFAAGYVAMARHVLSTGPFYSYIARGLNKPVGVGASFISVIAYNSLQIGLYGGFGAVAQDLVKTWFDVQLPWGLYALAAWVAVVVLGIQRVEMTGKILGVLLVIEILVVIVLDVADFAHPYHSSYAPSTFNPHNLFVAGAGVAFVIALTSFTGFETAPVFSEESREVKRTVPLATYLALLVMGVLYVGTSWAMATAVGAGNVISTARQDQADMIFNVAATNGRLGTGSVILDLGHLLLLTSIFAGLLSYHNSVARYTFALGRERVLPQALTGVRRRNGAPVAASAAQSGLALTVIVAFIIGGWDPLKDLFFWGGTAGGFGILILVVGISISVIKYFAHDHQQENPWSRLIAPAISTVIFGAILYQTIKSYDVLLDVDAHSIGRWIPTIIYIVAFAGGILWALILRRTRRNVYDAIGLGAGASSWEDLYLPPAPPTP